MNMTHHIILAAAAMAVKSRKGLLSMANDRVFNFSAGPSMLPLEVLERAGAEITNYNGP